MIWIYAICDRPELPPPPGRGLEQAPLEGLCEGPLQAVLSRHAGPVGEPPAPDALWAHERVVEQLMADRAVLPMRFGSRVADDDALRRVLASGREAYVAALARVSGRVELAVRALARDGAPEPVPAGVSGREYVMAKLEGGRRSAGEAAALHAPLAELAADARMLSGRAGELLRGAYLVDRPAVARFRAVVERLQAAHPEAAILCTGPWPPYSFAT